MENTKATKWLEKGDDWFDWYECPDCGFKARLRAVTGVELPELPKLCPNCFPESRRIKLGDVIRDEKENRTLVVVEIKRSEDARSSDTMLRTKDNAEYAYLLNAETGMQETSNVLSLETESYPRFVSEEVEKHELRYTVIGQARSALDNYLKAKKWLIAGARAVRNNADGKVV